MTIPIKFTTNSGRSWKMNDRRASHPMTVLPRALLVSSAFCFFACGCSTISSSEPDLAPAVQTSDPICATPEPSLPAPKTIVPLSAQSAVKPTPAPANLPPMRDRLATSPELTVTVLEPIPIKSGPALK